MQNLHTSLSTAAGEVDAANPQDPIPFTGVLERSSRGLIALRSGLEEAKTGFDGNAELRAAAQASPSCQRIGFGGPAPPPGPAS